MASTLLPRTLIDKDGHGANISLSGKLEVVTYTPIANIILVPLVMQLSAKTLALNTVVDAYTVKITTSATGILANQHIRVIDPVANRYYFGGVISTVSQTITLDTPMDYVYTSGREVTVSTDNLAVNGSSTPKYFNLRTGTPSIVVEVDITRIKIACTCTTPVDLAKFGNLTKLTKGLVFRWHDGVQLNIFNVKSNYELLAISNEFQEFLASNPSQGLDGFGATIIFEGDANFGTAIRVPSDANLQFIVQDDLSTLTSLKVMAMGHVVVEE